MLTAAELIKIRRERVRWIYDDRTVASLLIEFSVENPPPYSRIQDLIERGKLNPLGAARILGFFQMAADSTVTGLIEPASTLREETTDTMGEDTDDGLGVGEAESWFRERRERKTFRHVLVQFDGSRITFTEDDGTPFRCVDPDRNA